jgi:CBS domain-containing protein
MRAEALTLIFLAKLAGTPVFDPNAERVGKVRDAVASSRSDRQSPRILGFVVEVPQRRKIFIPITRVTSINDGGVFITGSLNIRRYQQSDNEHLLLAEYLDREATHIATNERVLIEDIAIEMNPQRDWFAARLHILKGARRLRRGASETVSWSDVEFDGGDNRHSRIAQQTDELHAMPAQDLAAALHDLELDRRAEIVKTMDDDKLADVLEEMDDADRVALVTKLEGERAADVLGEMAPDDAADVLREVGGEKAESLLELMEEEEAEDVRRLMHYEDYSAGGMMTTDPVILSSDATIADALAAVRQKELAPALAAQVFVCRAPLETPTGRLIGVVHVQELLRKPPALTLGVVVDTESNSLSPDTPLNDVVKHLANYNLIAAPIVDDNDRLLGAVTVDDVLDHLLPANWRNTERRS